ncbi:MAG: type IV secretory system conjugative DNA transfer family protein [Acaryochloris sp. RU_4_1]|nr:type IV secretory system conjugative DNA transfer family protein [Acaryochloris sp. RU_4_1]NJR57141.1 type IV secretory system conjugative DNA transfer family protein [Acaryochloris sp. CRU_2_0]
MQYHTQQPAQRPQISSPQMDFQVYVMSGLFLLIVILIIITKGEFGRKKQKLGDARVAKDKEMRRAQNLAYDALEARERNKITLWAGEPKGLIIDNDNRQIFIPRDFRSWIFAYLEEHFLAFGSSGSGKTFSLMAPMQRSMIKLGLPLCIFDAKGHEEIEDRACPSSEIAGFARLHGYKVKIIAPGYDDSDIFSIFDMMQAKDGRSAYEDKDGAYTVSDVLNENMQMHVSESGDQFFPLASKQLMQATFMWAKMLDPDGDELILAYYLLKRIAQVGAKGIEALDLPPYVQIAFDQFLVSAGSPETAASIAGTALILFGRMITPATLATFCGKSTVDLNVTGKTLVIFRLNPKMKASVGPMLATAIQSFLISNCYTARKQPLAFFLDEFQMIKICEVQKILTVARSNGVGLLFSTQGMSFIEETYGEKTAMGIVEGCKTQLLGQLNANKVAEYFGKQLDKCEVVTRSRSKSSGKSSSTSHSDSPHAKDLFAIRELLGIPQGTFIVLSRAIENKELARIPMRRNFVIPQWEKQETKRGIQEWFKYRPVARKLSKAKAMSNEEMLRYRDRSLELLPDQAEEVAAPPQDDGTQILAIGLSNL